MEKVHKDILFHTSELKDFCDYNHVLSDVIVKEYDVVNDHLYHHTLWCSIKSKHHSILNKQNVWVMYTHKSELGRMYGESDENYNFRLDLCKEDLKKNWYIDHHADQYITSDEDEEVINIQLSILDISNETWEDLKRRKIRIIN